jgi:hypothetical protein
MSSTSVPNGLTNEKGQGASHATSSSVPGAVQDKAPKSVEHKVDTIIRLARLRLF